MKLANTLQTVETITHVKVATHNEQLTVDFHCEAISPRTGEPVIRDVQVQWFMDAAEPPLNQWWVRSAAARQIHRTRSENPSTAKELATLVRVVRLALAQTIDADLWARGCAHTVRELVARLDQLDALMSTPRR